MRSNAKAMGNIWEIDIEPRDGMKYLELLYNTSMLDMCNSDYNTCAKQLQVEAADERISRALIESKKSERFHKRRNAYGNIWNFKTYNN